MLDTKIVGRDSKPALASLTGTRFPLPGAFSPAIRPLGRDFPGEIHPLKAGKSAGLGQGCVPIDSTRLDTAVQGSLDAQQTG